MTCDEEPTAASQEEECDEESRRSRLKAEAEKVVDSVVNTETREHLTRAGVELMMALDSMLPKGLVPDDVKEHYRNAKRETALMMKAIIDHQVERGRCVKEEAKGLKKIDLE